MSISSIVDYLKWHFTKYSTSREIRRIEGLCMKRGHGLVFTYEAFKI